MSTLYNRTYQIRKTAVRKARYNHAVTVKSGGHTDGDFLAIRPQGLEPYDLIVMNPPFDLERDIDHVTHALKFLKPSGSLHAIMSAGTEFRETRKAIAFRALVESMGGKFTDMPAGSFAEVGTYVNTVILRLRKKP